MFSEPPPQHSAVDLRIGIVVSRYHEEITAALLQGARDRFTEAGGRLEDVTVLYAPGAWEIPVLIDALAYSSQCDALVALGCVITGETTHDRYIADAVAAGLQRIAVESGTPTAFGILTCQTIEQARERAGVGKGNKGAEAMRAAIDAAGELRRLWEVSEDDSL